MAINKTKTFTYTVGASFQLPKYSTLGFNNDELANAGYVFSGWNTESNGSGDTIPDNAETTFYNEFKTLYAQYSLSKFTVTFINTIGELEEIFCTKEVEYGGTVEDIDTPIIEGYTFKYWDPQPKNVKSDLTCYGIFGSNQQVTIYRYLDKDTRLSSLTVAANSTLNETNLPATSSFKQEYYWCANYYSNVNGIQLIYPINVAEEPLNLYVYEEKNEFTPIFRYSYKWDGQPHYCILTNESTVKTSQSTVEITVEYSEDGTTYSTTPISLTDPGSKPVWCRITANDFITFSKKYDLSVIQNGYEVTYLYYLRDSLDELVSDVHVYEPGSDGNSFKPPTLNGKLFSKWDKQTDLLSINKDIATTAIYTVITFIVTYMDGSSVWKTEEVAYGGSATLTEHPGCGENEEWKYWGDENGNKIELVNITADITAYACKTTFVDFTLTYMLNDESFFEEEDKIQQGVTLSKSTLKNTYVDKQLFLGKKFKEFDPNQESYTFNADTSLTAIYELSQRIVIYNSNAVSIPSDMFSMKVENASVKNESNEHEIKLMWTKLTPSGLATASTIQFYTFGYEDWQDIPNQQEEYAIRCNSGDVIYFRNKNSNSYFSKEDAIRYFWIDNSKTKLTLNGNLQYLNDKDADKAVCNKYMLSKAFLGCTDYYGDVIVGCSSIQTANCLNELFYNSNNLNSIKVLFSTWNNRIMLWNWVKGCQQTSASTFKCPESLDHSSTYVQYGAIPTGWTIQTF